MSYFIFPKITNCLKYNDFKIDFSSNINFHISITLHNYLLNIKKEIDNFNILWDNFKKLTNPYEYIHTYNNEIKSSICKLKPISRAFYKMIELCNIFNLLNIDQDIKSFHLAEGPGGFMEAINYLRNNNINDKYYGITLINNDINVPSWKKSKIILDNPKINIEYGISKDGNLFNKSNLLHYYETMYNSIDIITGDGGFDFSLDFNNQETNSFKLILVQIIYAICIQKKGGSFILKIFDIFTLPTIQIIFILSSIYESVYICKPNTSRIANSEKYIICKKYKINTDIINFFINNFDLLFNTNTNNNIISLLKINIPYLFINKLEEFNAIYGQQQIENINFTINLINIHKNKIKLPNQNIQEKLNNNKDISNVDNDNNVDDNYNDNDINDNDNYNDNNDNNFKYIKTDNNNLEIIKKNNIQKCILWCEKNNLPHIIIENNQN